MPPVAGSTLYLKSDVATYESNGGSPSSDSGVMGYWEDQSGNGNHVEQITTSKKPLLINNVQNGLPIIRGDGSDDSLHTINTISLTNFTIHIVFIPITFADARLLYHYDGADGWFLNNTWQFGLNHITPAASVPWEMMRDKPYIATIQRSGGQILLRQNGEEVGVDTLTIPTTIDEIYIFSDLVEAKNSNCDIGEILVYSSGLSSGDIDTNESYLSSRWNITLDGIDTFLTIPTYDGSNQAIHPSVIDFGAGETWNNHRYWMAMTPYPNGDDDFENPSIVVSSDKLAWSVPSGLTNPIDPFPGGSNHNADTDLLYAQDDKLYCYYLDTTITGYKMNVRSSSDGVNWGAETTLFTGSNAVTQSVIWDNSQYIMWYLKDTDRSLRKRTSSSPNSGWSSESSALTINNIPSGTAPWNIHMRLLNDGSYLSLIHFPPTGLQLGGALWFALSNDGETWTVEDDFVLETSQFTWITSSIYRACFNEASENVYDIWFSGRRSDETWNTSYWLEDRSIPPNVAYLINSSGLLLKSGNNLLISN